MSDFLRAIRKYFISGLIIFIPFIITIYLLIEITKWLNTFVNFTPARFLTIPYFFNSRDIIYWFYSNSWNIDKKFIR